MMVSSYGQGLFERFPNRPEQSTALLLSYRNQLEIRGFGSCSLYGVPIRTNSPTSIICIVTARHNLIDKANGNLLDGVILKANAKKGNKPIYIKIPLKHDEPRNYWSSPTGLDLVLIPLPPEVFSSADFASFTEKQIVTPESASNLKVKPGMLVIALCMQPEYTEPIDFLLPETFPILRTGHLSRLGFQHLPDNTQVIRNHVIDLHSSPGNSGATVLVYVPTTDQKVSQPMFLGIVQGFPEETGSYIPYEAPLTTSSSTNPNFTLVNAETQETNHIALTIKTIANPDLTSLVPVHELVGVGKTKMFLDAALIMTQNEKQYESYNILPLPK